MSDPDQRLQRVIAAFVRQEFGAPVTTIIGLTDILIEDARRSGDETYLADFARIRSAGLLLQEQLGGLVNLATQGPVGDDRDPAGFKGRLRHNLRTPLNAVKGYSELIIEDARDSDRADVLVDVRKILAAAEELLVQIDRLVDLADPTASGGGRSAPQLDNSIVLWSGQRAYAIDPARHNKVSRPVAIWSYPSGR